MFFLNKTPIPGYAGTSPRGGRFTVRDLPPLGEVSRSDEGGLVSPSVFPAKAGTQTLSHGLKTAHRTKATKGIINSSQRQSPGLLRCARNDAGDGGVDEHPLPRLRRYFPQRGKIYRP